MMWKRGILSILFWLGQKTFADDAFDVISISNVPFPSSSGFSAGLSAPYKEEIAEFTICYGFLISSYNERWITLLWAKELENSPPSYDRHYKEFLAFDIGVEYRGYQFLSTYLYRNLPNGASRVPLNLHGNLPQFVQPGKWFHVCSSYSSKLHIRHVYYNGLKVSSVKYTDEVEDPMPSDTFKNVVIGQNIVSLLTF